MKNVTTEKALKNKRSVTTKVPSKTVPKVALKSQHKKALLHVRKNRSLHKRVALHPITVFILLCSIVYLGNWTYRVAADSLVITAKVSAPLLTEPATISTPTDGTTVLLGTTSVTGTCPNGSYIILLRNDIMSGVALCTASNSYTIDTSLYPGSNILRVQDYNVTDDAGPITPPITITYNPPVPPAPLPAPSPTPSTQPSSNQSPSTTSTIAPTSSSDSTTANPSLPTLSNNFVYQAFSVNTTASWHIIRNGGVAPYNLLITWGDGTTSTQVLSTDQTFVISHRYKKTGYYSIKIRITDARGQEAILQIIAIIKPPTSTGTTVASISNTTTKSLFNTSGFTSAKRWLALAWGSIFIVGMMILSFWLGEHQRAFVMQSSHRAIRASRTRRRK